jgi:hypothetical protein
MCETNSRSEEAATSHQDRTVGPASCRSCGASVSSEGQQDAGPTEALDSARGYQCPEIARRLLDSLLEAVAKPRE